jgi:hypothetical protein
MDVPEKANDGKSNRVLFSGIAGDSMQQVVLCSDWCALEVLPNPSTHTEEHVIVVYPSTGKPSALKGACSVWTGGKSVSSYLSVFTGGEVKNDACSQIELTWTNLNGPERPPGYLRIRRFPRPSTPVLVRDLTVGHVASALRHRSSQM